MNETPTTSGASNASDFQPLTQNPQTGSPNLQPTTTGPQPVEGNTAGRLDQLPASTLKVETAQSGTTSRVSQDTSGGGFSFTGLLPFIIVLLLAIWLFRRWNLFSPEPSLSEITPEPQSVAVAAAPEKTTKTPKKTTKSKTKTRKKSKKK
jgi:hypothetical protein